MAQNKTQKMFLLKNFVAYKFIMLFARLVNATEFYLWVSLPEKAHFALVCCRVGGKLVFIYFSATFASINLGFSHSGRVGFGVTGAKGEEENLLDKINEKEKFMDGDIRVISLEGIFISILFTAQLIVCGS